MMENRISIKPCTSLTYLSIIKYVKDNAENLCDLKLGFMSSFLHFNRWPFTTKLCTRVSQAPVLSFSAHRRSRRRVYRLVPDLVGATLPFQRLPQLPFLLPHTKRLKLLCHEVFHLQSEYHPSCIKWHNEGKLVLRV